MKKFFAELLARFTSRKFLFTLGGSVALYYSRQYNEMVVLILGYVGVEGASDVVSKYKKGVLTASDIESLTTDDVDRSGLVSGSGKLLPSDIEVRPGLDTGADTPT